MKLKKNKLNFLILLSWLGVRPTALTCAGRTDGAGAQILGILSLQAFCEHYNFTYAHTPFAEIDHTTSDDDVLAWENLFQLGTGYKTIFDFQSAKIVSISEYLKNPLLWFGNVIVSLPHAYEFADYCDDAYDSTISRLRTRLAAFHNNLERKKVNIAVHIRRGDVDANRNPERFTSNESIFALLSFIAAELDAAGKGYEINIFSEGTHEDFLIFKRLNCIFHLNTNPIDVLKQLSVADILITAKSSFSYVAALINPNLVIHEKLRHRKRLNWVDRSDLESIKNEIHNSFA